MNACLNLTSGFDNAVVGIYALKDIEEGSENAGIGTDVGRHLVHSSRNTLLGGMAGRFFTAVDNTGPTPNYLTKADFCIYIGYRSAASANDVNREVAIGYKAVGRGSGTISIGSPEHTKTHLESIRVAGSGERNLSLDPSTKEVTVTDGAWTSYTPAIVSGAGTYTFSNLRARYRKDGRRIHFCVSWVDTGGGSGTIIVPLPVPAAGPTVVNAIEDTTQGVLFSAIRTYSGPDYEVATLAHPSFAGGITGSGRRFIISGTYEAAA